MTKMKLAFWFVLLWERLSLVSGGEHIFHTMCAARGINVWFEHIPSGARTYKYTATKYVVRA